MGHSDYPVRLHDWLSLYFDLAAADPRFARDRQRGEAAYWHWVRSRLIADKPRRLLVEKAFQVEPEALWEGSPDLVQNIWGFVFEQFDKALGVKALPWVTAQVARKSIAFPTVKNG
jgi:hypothetical protein